MMPLSTHTGSLHTASGRKRTTVRGLPTQLSIIETAERLFGQHGIKGVSLRQISSEAGSARNGAVVYHFKDLKGLLGAIFEHRIPALEKRRREMLAVGVTSGRAPEVRDLLKMLFVPLTEIVDESGNKTYATFLAGLFRSHQVLERRKLVKSDPVTSIICDQLAQHLSHLPIDSFKHRLWAVSDMVLNGLACQVADETVATLDELLDMAVGALEAPVTHHRPVDV